MEQLLLSGSVHIALRTFFIGLSAFNGSINEFEKFMSEIDKMDYFSIFDFHANNSDSVKNHLRFLNCLSRSKNYFALQSHETILENHPDLCAVWRKNKFFIRDFLQRQCQTNDYYFHGIFDKKFLSNCTQTNDLQQPIATGWLPFIGLVNHSCGTNNVMRLCIDGKIALIVSRFIPANSQLFDCYKLELYFLPYNIYLTNC
jgi:hypothetical protein